MTFSSWQVRNNFIFILFILIFTYSQLEITHSASRNKDLNKEAATKQNMLLHVIYMLCYYNVSCAWLLNL